MIRKREHEERGGVDHRRVWYVVDLDPVKDRRRSFEWLM